MSNLSLRVRSLIVLLGLCIGLLGLTIGAYAQVPIDSPVEINEDDGTRGELPAGVLQDAIYVGFNGDGTIGGITYRDEDIMAYDRSTGVWYHFFDGSDVGIDRNVDAFTLMSDGSALLSFSPDAAVVPGIAGTVDDADLIRFVPTAWGTVTAGHFEFYFDGSDVGLEANSNQEDIDGVFVDATGNLYISTFGNVVAAGNVPAFDEDILKFTPTTLGANTTGTWSFYFDGSDVGLTDLPEDIADFWYDPVANKMYLTTEGIYDVGALTGDGADLITCELVATGRRKTVCDYDSEIFFDGSALGLVNQRVDSFFIAPAAQRSEVLYISPAQTLQLGGMNVLDEDIMGYDRDMDLWFMLFDGSDVGLNLLNVDAFAFLNDGSIVMSFSNEGIVLPGITGTVDDSDLVRFIPTRLGVVTQGSFALYFDGSDVGLEAPSEDVVGVYIQQDGALYLTTYARPLVPGAEASWADEDIVRFQPTMLGQNTAGSWSLFFDGSDVGLASVAQGGINGMWQHPVSGALYLLAAGPFAVTGVSGESSDVFVCNPISLGTNTACNYQNTLFFDGSDFGILNTQPLDGIELTVPAAQLAPSFAGRAADDQALPLSALDDHLSPEEIAELRRVPTAVTLAQLDTAQTVWPAAAVAFALLLVFSALATRRLSRH